MTDGRNGPNGHERPAAETPADELTLADVLEDLAEDFPDVEQRLEATAIEYAVGQRPFVRLVGTTAHFRLRPEIVGAAIRTPGAAASPLGPEWVAFRPVALDQYALDRAQSWFELGHRLALEAPGGATKRH